MNSIIVAISKNNGIGKNNELLFNIKEDMLFFKKTTLNKTIVMGRKTFESLPNVLPQRKHIVITRDEDYIVNHPMVEIRHSLLDVLEEFNHQESEVCIIGGGQIYKQALDTGLVDKLYITRVNKYVDDVDTFFPNIGDYPYSIVNEIILNEDAIVQVYEKNN